MSKLGNAVKAGLVSLLLGASSCNRQTDADRFYHDFPTSIEGAREVVKYETSGAKHCLVHVRQVHYTSPKMSKNDLLKLIGEAKNGKEYEGRKLELERDILKIQKYIDDYSTSLYEVSNVQSNIKEILEGLCESIKLDFLRGEGVTKDLSAEDCFQIFSFGLKSVLRSGYADKNDLGLNGKYSMVGGAFCLLGARGILKIKSAEDKKIIEPLIKKKNESYRRLKTPDLDLNLLFDRREDYLLELISKEEEPNTVTVFGANHDFRDNVDAWNKEHPNDRFSLIVVTPKSLKD